MAKTPSSSQNAGRTDAEKDLLDTWAYGEAAKKRKAGDTTPMKQLMEKIKKKGGSKFLFGTDRKIDRGE